MAFALGGDGQPGQPALTLSSPDLAAQLDSLLDTSSSVLGSQWIVDHPSVLDNLSLLLLHALSTSTSVNAAAAAAAAAAVAAEDEPPTPQHHELRDVMVSVARILLNVSIDQGQPQQESDQNDEESSEDSDEDGLDDDDDHLGIGLGGAGGAAAADAEPELHRVGGAAANDSDDGGGEAHHHHRHHRQRRRRRRRRPLRRRDVLGSHRTLMRGLIEALGCPYDEVAASCADCLWNLTAGSDRAKTNMLQLGAVDRLVALLSRSDEHIVVATLCVLTNMAASPKPMKWSIAARCRNHIVRALPLPAIKPLFDSHDDQIVDAAVRVIWALSWGGNAEEQLNASNTSDDEDSDDGDDGSDARLRVLSAGASDTTPDPTLTPTPTPVSGALSTLQYKEALMEYGVIDKLVALLSHRSRSVCKTAVCTVEALSAGLVNAQLREAMAAGDAIPALLGLLRGTLADDPEPAARALMNLSYSHAGCSVLIEQHLGEVFAWLPAAGADLSKIQEKFFFTLSNMTAFASPEQIPLLRDLGLAERVASWIDNDAVSVNVACVIANLVGTVDSHPLLDMQAQLPHDLVRELRLALDCKPSSNGLLYDPWELVQGIAKLSFSVSNREHILDAKPLPLLLRALNDHFTDPFTTEFASMALANLASVADVHALEPALRPCLERVAAAYAADTPSGTWARRALCGIRSQTATQQAKRRRVVRERHGKRPSTSSCPTRVFVSAPAGSSQISDRIENYLESHLSQDLEIHRCHGASVSDLECLEQSDACIFVCSAATKQSEPCREQFEFAEWLRKEIIAITIPSFAVDGWLRAVTKHRATPLGDLERVLSDALLIPAVPTVPSSACKAPGTASYSAQPAPRLVQQVGAASVLGHPEANAGAPALASALAMAARAEGTADEPQPGPQPVVVDSEPGGSTASRSTSVWTHFRNCFSK